LLKIGILAIHAFHSSLGTMEVISEISKALSDRNVEIHIFTPFENDLKYSKIHIHNLPSFGSELGLGNVSYKILRNFYSSPFFAKNFFLRKKAIEMSVNVLTERLLPFLNRINLDILQGEQEIPALACIKLGMKKGIPTIAHLRNFWPEECVDIGLIKRDSGTYRALHEMIGEILVGADRVFTVSGYAKQFLENEYGIYDKIIELPRGGSVIPMDIDYENRSSSVVYSGSISRHENLPLFIESIPRVEEKMEDTLFYITGKGNYLRKIKSLARNLSVNPHFLWFPKKDRLQKFLSHCSLGVIPWAKTISRRFGFPIKLLDYLSVGLPVVTTNVGGWTEIVKKERLGLITEGTPESFAEGIIKILNNSDLAEECGRRGLNLIKERYNWENTAKILIREYNGLI